jgi:hypothetical protein
MIPKVAHFVATCLLHDVQGCLSRNSRVIAPLLGFFLFTHYEHVQRSYLSQHEELGESEMSD